MSNDFLTISGISMFLTLTFLMLFYISSSYYNIIVKPKRKYLASGVLIPLTAIAVYLLIPYVITLAMFYAVLYSITVTIAMLIKRKTSKVITVKRFSLKHNNRKYRVEMHYSEVPNAWADLLSNRIVTTTKLLDILSREELNAVLFHEIGHLNNRVLKMIFLCTTILWNMLMPFTVLFLRYLLSKMLIGITMTEILTLTFMLFIAYTLTALITFVNWAYEHEADIYAATMVSPQTYGRALTKIAACIRLKELCALEAINKISTPQVNKITQRDVLKEFLYLMLKMPLGFIDMFRNKPYPTHPPLRFRLYVIHHISKTFGRQT